MEEQRQELKQVHQESLRQNTRVHELNRTNDILSTRDNSPNHWGAHSYQVLGVKNIIRPLLNHLMKVTSEKEILWAKEDY